MRWMSTAMPHEQPGTGARSDEREHVDARDVRGLLLEARSASEPTRRELLDQVVVVSMPIAEQAVRRYRNRGVALEDLRQVAYIGLVLAAQRFDPDKAHDFASYAVPTIHGEIRRYFRDHGWCVRPPRCVQQTYTLIVQDFGRTDGRSDSTAEIAARLGVEVQEVTDALAARTCFSPTSLDSAAHEGGSETLGDRLVDDEFDEHAAVEARMVLRTLTEDLQPRERLVLYLRFVEGLSQQQIADEIGATQVQVYRLITRVLKQVRDRLGAEERVA